MVQLTAQKKASTIRYQLLEIRLIKYALLGFLYFDSNLTKLDEFIRTGANFVSAHFFSNRNTEIFHQKELVESCRGKDHSRQYDSYIYILSTTDKIVLRGFIL